MKQPGTHASAIGWTRQGRGMLLVACWLGLGAALPCPARAAESGAPPALGDAGSPLEAPGAGAPPYLALGLEDLMNTRVTSVSRKSQQVADAAAAVFVITQDDIRRSGVTSIAEALRMAPGVEVARIDANKWAVSSRGSNGRFASKMLVLFDGRSVYTPLFSGVFWDRQDTVLEDVERIEVIRGPGAALWGANAVNGVINIITRSAQDTLGTLASAGAGTSERGFGSLRYGRQLDEDSALRVFANYLSRAGQQDLAGRQAENGWSALRGGFRLDSEPSAASSVTLQGELFSERLHETYVGSPPAFDPWQHRTPVFGANLLSRWKQSLSEGSDLELQLYYDRTDTRMGVIDELRDTVDLDFQHRYQLSARQDLVWGAGFRYSHDRIGNPTAALTLLPEQQSTYLFSSFVQDDITLVPDRLHLVVGSKFEVNSYTGFELQPNARAIWTPSRRHTVWGAVSRAVRTPSRGEESLSLYLPGPAPGVLTHLIGNRHLQAEELVAHELGYRMEPWSSLTLDLATFYNRYRKLSILGSGQPLELSTPFAPQVAFPLTLGNLGRAETWGAELAADYRASNWWRLRGTYSYFKVLSSQAPAGAVFSIMRGEDPQHQVSLRSSWDVSRQVEFDLWLRYVSALSFQDTSGSPPLRIDGYLTLDCRLAWKPWRGLELALVGQNLLQDEHREFLPQQILTQPTQVGRSFYGKATWQF